MILLNDEFNRRNFLDVVQGVGYTDGYHDDLEDATGYTWTNVYKAIEDFVDRDEQKSLLHAFPEINLENTCNSTRFVCYPSAYWPGSTSEWFGIEYDIYALDESNRIDYRLGYLLIWIGGDQFDSYYINLGE